MQAQNHGRISLTDWWYLVFICKMLLLANLKCSCSCNNIGKGLEMTKLTKKSCRQAL